MADSVGVKVTGLNEVRSVLRVIGDRDLQKALMAANKTAAQVVVNAAVVPERSGRLKASVKALGSQKSGRATAKAPHAAAIHWGRKRGNVGRPPGNRQGANPIKGRPFLEDAARAHDADVAQVYEVEIDKVLDAIRRFTA